MSKETNSTTPERLAMTAADVAQALDISVRQVWKLAASGRLIAPFRLGRSVRWRADELRAWISAGCPAQEAWAELKRDAAGAAR